LLERTVQVELTQPHSAQQEILDEAQRFNVVCCGRRFGKTTLAEELVLSPDDLTNGALNGYPVAYFAPSYKMLMEVWRTMLEICYPVTEYKSDAEKRIELYGGGIIDFWSLDSPDSPRGRKYKRVVVDESALVLRLKEAWTKAIRPTLTDLKGDAWFLSTPRGKNNFFYELYKYDALFKDWKSWQKPTISNPYIDPAEVEEARLQLDPLTFAQEYLASFVTENNNAFCYTYSPAKHNKPTKINPQLEVKLSFDFNRDPITCLVAQDNGVNIVNFIEQIKLQNSNIYDLCDVIKAKYGRNLLIVTGDATGRNSSALVKDNINYFKIIKAQLGLGDRQMKQPVSNPTLVENRVLVNSAFHHLDISIDPVNCKGLIFDLEHAAVLPDGSLDKSDRNDPTKQLDALDCARYYFNTFFKHILKIT